MNPHTKPGAGIFQELCIRFRFRRGNTATLVLAPLLTYIVAHAHILDDGNVIDVRRDSGPLDESVLLDPAAHVSVHETAGALLVQVFNGKVMFKPKNAHPIVVTAGNARINAVNAAICVGVQSDQTSVTVIAGAVRLAALSFADNSPTTGKVGTDTHVVNEMNLRAGDRAEIIKTGPNVTIRLESSARFPSECS